MRAFVIRPFRHYPDLGFDPDLVHATLIGPALAEVGYMGGTSASIADSGSVPERMIREIIDADLVIADISMHNPNVYYEIGVRHALRPTGTVLIRARADDQYAHEDVPFDVEGWSYVGYDRRDPGQKLAELVSTIRASQALGTVDSPVFRLFPDLQVDASGWDRLPLDLAEEIDVAKHADSGGDLRMFAEDVVGTRFEEAALRRIARAQGAVGDRIGACSTWEAVLHRRRDDYEANHELATIYSRLDPNETRSELAIGRALQNARLTPYEQADLHALRGRNLKDTWQREYLTEPITNPRQRALRSSTLDAAIDTYLAAFHHSLDNYYAGLNALALTDVQICLANELPEVWVTNYRDDIEAADALAARQRLRTWLCDAVGISLQRTREHQRAAGTDDPWLDASSADHMLIATDDAARVVAAYERAAGRLGPDSRESVLRQLTVYNDLGIRLDLVERAIESVGGRYAQARSIGPTTEEIVVFAGHLPDPPNVSWRRFPMSAVDDVRAALLGDMKSLRDECLGRGARLVGLASASAGGDLLFHDVCQELGITREVFLVVPDADFRATGISREGPSQVWMERYLAAVAPGTPIHILDRTPHSPSWRDATGGEHSWERWKRWMIHHAQARSGRVTALVLWDGQPPRGTAGVAAFVDTAAKRGVPVQIVRLAEIVGEGSVAVS